MHLRKRHNVKALFIIVIFWGMAIGDERRFLTLTTDIFINEFL